MAENHALGLGGPLLVIRVTAPQRAAPTAWYLDTGCCSVLSSSAGWWPRSEAKDISGCHTGQLTELCVLGL